MVRHNETDILQFRVHTRMPCMHEIEKRNRSEYFAYDDIRMKWRIVLLLLQFFVLWLILLFLSFVAVFSHSSISIRGNLVVPVPYNVRKFPHTNNIIFPILFSLFNPVPWFSQYDCRLAHIHSFSLGIVLQFPPYNEYLQRPYRIYGDAVYCCWLAGWLAPARSSSSSICCGYTMYMLMKHCICWCSTPTTMRWYVT